MKIGSLIWLGLVCAALCVGGGITARAKDPVSVRERSVHEQIVLESIGKGAFVVVACPFAFERKKLSPEKYEVITEYAVVKALEGGLEFGAKFKVKSLVEGILDERPTAPKRFLGDFRFLILFDQANIDI
jgi:hypothetical protein